MKIEMTEGSPIVPTESQILEIPIFPSAAPPMNFGMNPITPRPLQRITQYSHSHSLTDFAQRVPCQCPHVLVADDDPFQSFYYETLFQKSISWEEILGSKENFRFEIFSSGEDLIRFFNRNKACGCERPVLIISDYNMGDKKLNGLETIKALRKCGYKGNVILRTSEEKEVLVKKHPELPGMLESRALDCYVEKSNFKKAKEVIQSLVRDVKK